MKHSVTRLATATLAIACALLLGAGATTPPAEAPSAPPSGKTGRALIVPIKGEINRTQAAYVHRALSGAKGQYDAVIFELDTPGGRIDFMSRISNDIRKLAPTRTIAFVSPWAISAGAYVAMSADRIYVSPGAIIGGARGWVPGPGGVPVELPEHVEEKLASINRAQFRALADAKGYPPAIAESMADEAIEVTKVVYDGKTMYLTKEEMADFENDPLKKDKLKVVEIVSREGKLGTYTAEQAVRWDLARRIVRDLDEVLKEENLESVAKVREGQNASDKIVAILTIPQVMGLLILVGFGALWLEAKIPGFGAPGTLGIIAFVLVFSSQFLVGNANALEIMLFVIGLVLLFIELFVTPGFGFIGGAGIVCLLVALVLAMQPFVVPTQPWEWRSLEFNVLATLGGVLGSLVVIAVAAWVLPSTPMFARLTLRKQLKVEEGYSSGVPEGESLVGQAGVVVTALRPAGKLEIGDETYSVVSDSEFVDAGRRARIVRVDGPKIVVEPLEEPKPKEPELT